MGEIHHLYDKLPRNKIVCLDMNSYYVSCTALLENLDVKTVPMAIVSDLKRPGAVVLSANRALKELFKSQNIRVGTGTRLYEIPKHPAIRLFEPKMEFYIKMSVEITNLVATIVPRENIWIYSIDEFFVSLDGLESLLGDAETIVKVIQNAIYQQFKIPSSACLGSNFLLSKLGLDLEAKKTGFATWTYEDVQNKLWPVSPLSEMWGIGKRTEKKLNALGIHRVGDLANANLEDIEKAFGRKIGNQLYYHANGIDLTSIKEKNIDYAPARSLSFGKSLMLMKDYHTRPQICVPLLEMCEDVAKRARDKGYSARTISLGLAHSRTAIMSENFLRSITLEEPTNDTLTIYNVCKQLLNEFFGGEPARQLSVRISNVSKERGMQLDLFDTTKDKRNLLSHTVDAIRNRFGAASLLRAVSYTDMGTANQRAKLVAGHKK